MWVYWLCSCAVSLSLLPGVLPQLWVQIYLNSDEKSVCENCKRWLQSAVEIFRDMKIEIIQENCFLAEVTCGLYKTEVKLHVVLSVYIFDIRV